MCSDLPMLSLHMNSSEESIHSLGLGPKLLCTQFGDGLWTLLGDLLTILMRINQNSHKCEVPTLNVLNLILCLQLLQMWL